MADKALVFDTARYMIEDGPGIRDAIFFKGCPLRCRWCSNPFGLTGKKEIAFSKKKCGGCGRCISACPKHAVMLSDEGFPETDHDRCTACGACIRECLYQARTEVGTEMTVSDVMEFLVPDMSYFNRSGGGVTLTGGEVLRQSQMAVKILSACKSRMIHRTVETSGYGNWDNLQKIMSLADVVFMDLKHMDPERHSQLTGVSNEIILDNIRKAAEYYSSKKRKLLVIRIPVIPGMNDDEDNIRRSGRFVASLPGCPQINLLPFHALGETKYEMIGRTYDLQGLEPPKTEEMQKYKKLIEAEGCRCSTGGANVIFSKE